MKYKWYEGTTNPKHDGEYACVIIPENGGWGTAFLYYVNGEWRNNLGSEATESKHKPDYYMPLVDFDVLNQMKDDNPAFKIRDYFNDGKSE